MMEAQCSADGCEHTATLMHKLYVDLEIPFELTIYLCYTHDRMFDRRKASYIVTKASRRRQSNSASTKRKRDTIAARDGGYECFHCGKPLTDKRPISESKSLPHDYPTLDHLIPLSHPKGSNELWNLVLSCHNCNRKKANHLIQMYMDIAMDNKRLMSAPPVCADEEV